jgi:hypothetical protein
MPKKQTSVTAQLNHKLGPLERGERYEDPLAEALKEARLGELEESGGTMLSKEGEILFIDVHFFLFSLDEGIPFVTRFLEQRGAPKGSVLQMFRGDAPEKEIPFGLREGFGVYLNGVNLPDEVYRTCDVNLVIREFNQRLAGHGQYESYWQGPTETALYCYGDSNAVMKPLIRDFLESYPLCKGARVVDLTPAK